MGKLCISTLVKSYWDFAWKNPTDVSTIHAGILFFAISKNSEYNWKREFQLATNEAIGHLNIRSIGSYIKCLNDLDEYGFVDIIEKGGNQHRPYTLSLYTLRSTIHDNSDIFTNTDINGKYIPKATSLKEQDYCMMDEEEGDGTDLYFLWCGDYVKIGKTKNFLKRMNSMQTSLYTNQYVAYVFKNKGHKEKELQKIFKQYHSKGEWFVANDDMIRFCKAHLKSIEDMFYNPRNIAHPYTQEVIF